MTSDIVSDFHDFNFDGLSLAQPHAVQGGTYFTRLTNNENGLYMQTPKCSTKQGITRTEHKIYTDLVFSQDEESFIEWLEKLETKLQQMIYSKKTQWFHNDLELADIENAFTSLTRSFKSGNNCLVRCNLGKSNNTGLKQDIKIFNESEKNIKLDDIKPGDKVITIVEVSGIRFSSRSFHVDLYVKQLMVFQNSSPFGSCLIKPTQKVHREASLGNLEINNIKKAVESDDESVSSLSGINSDESDDDHEIANNETIISNEEVETNNTNLREVSNNDSEIKDQPVTMKSSTKEKEILGNMQKNTIGASPLDKTVNIEKDGEDLEEVELSFDTVDDEIKLRDPNEVYMQIYMEARHKAKLAKKVAIEAYLEAKKIKNTYLLEEIDDSDEEDMSSFSEN